MSDQHTGNTCRFLSKEYGVVPWQTWGDMNDPVLQKWWNDHNCNDLLLSTVAQPTATIAKTPALLATAYLGNWAGLPNPTLLGKLDRVCYAFWGLDPSGNITGRNTGTEAQFASLGPKILASIGGWGNCSSFSGVFGNPTLRQKAVTNLAQTIKAIGWHGLDIDWEFPSNAGDAQNFLSFCQLFKQQNPSLLLTIAGSTNVSYYSSIVQPFAQVLDSIHIMTYDYVGSWTPNSGWNSDLSDCSATVQQFIDAGFPPAKLQMGSAWYGRQATVTTMGTTNGWGKPALAWDELTFSQISDLKNGGGGWSYDFNTGAGGAWLANSTMKKVISYEDAQAVKAKRDYCLSKGLQGIFCWEWSQDDTAGTLAHAMLGN